MIWLTYLRKDLKVQQLSVPILYYDNMSTLHLSVNPIFHAWKKHFEMFQYLWEQVALKKIETQYISTLIRLLLYLPNPYLVMHFRSSFPSMASITWVLNGVKGI